MATKRNKGTVLIITIWITTILAGLAIMLSWQIRTDALQVENQIDAAKAEYIAAGGIEYALANIGSASDSNSEELFKEVKLGDGVFWLIKPDLSSDKQLSYGLIDESAKVNINSASQEMLLKLPGMTSELAASIIDWRDNNSEVTTGGAESEYYLLLSDSYECKNANFETVEEVLLVKGASRAILFGEDHNINSMLDDNENDGNRTWPDDNSNGSLDQGFFNYVTVYSREKNVDSEGKQRVNAANRRNQSETLAVLRTVLSDDASFTAMNRIRSRQRYANILDLYYTSAIKYDDFVELIDKLTTTDSEELVGLININTAPEEVLNCLPGLESSDVDALIVKRERLDDDEKKTILWVTKVLDQEKSIAIGSYITAKSRQFSADVVALTNNGRAFRRYRAVIDTVDDTAVIYRKSLSHLGWPLPGETLEKYRTISF